MSEQKNRDLFIPITAMLLDKAGGKISLKELTAYYSLHSGKPQTTCTVDHMKRKFKAEAEKLMKKRADISDDQFFGGIAASEPKSGATPKKRAAEVDDVAETGAKKAKTSNGVKSKGVEGKSVKSKSVKDKSGKGKSEAEALLDADLDDEFPDMVIY